MCYMMSVELILLQHIVKKHARIPRSQQLIIFTVHMPVLTVHEYTATAIPGSTGKVS